MQNKPASSLKMIRSILFKQFALSAFTALLFYDLFFNQIAGDFLDQTDLSHRPHFIIGSFLITGLVVALLNRAVISRLRRQSEYQAHIQELWGDEHRYFRLQITVAFCSGALVLPVLLIPQAVLALTVLLILLAYNHLRLFVRKIRRLMQPNHYAHWADVGEMLHVYLTMLAVFTMVMASIFVIHNLSPGLEPPLNLDAENTRFLDFVYFSVVVMTTLGFGDISPATYDAKILVSLQCLVSYFMFALMIGLVTKGILTKKNDA